MENRIQALQGYLKMLLGKTCPDRNRAEHASRLLPSLNVKKLTIKLSSECRGSFNRSSCSWCLFFLPNFLCLALSLRLPRLKQQLKPIKITTDRQNTAIIIRVASVPLKCFDFFEPENIDVRQLNIKKP